MAHDQPGRLSGILERIQDMQGLPQTGEMLPGPFRQKAGDAPCMAGCIGAGGRVYEDKQRETHLRLAQGNHGTIFLRSQRAAWPALCPHARNSQHVRAVLPHRRRTKHETHRQGVSFPFFPAYLMHRGCFREEAASMPAVCPWLSPGAECFLEKFCYRQQLQPVLQPVLQALLRRHTSSLLHSEAGGKRGRLKNSSHTFSANSSQGGMGQKP